MKHKKVITETKHSNGVYIMDIDSESLKVKGSTSGERLKNAVKDFLKTAEVATPSGSKHLESFAVK